MTQPQARFKFAVASVALALAPGASVSALAQVPAAPPAVAPPAVPATASEAPPDAGDRADLARLEACRAEAGRNPEAAWETGLQWQNELGGAPAQLCIAEALARMERHADAAARFESLAVAPDGGSPEDRARHLIRAGNLRLLAREPARARDDFGAALGFLPGEAEILIDRARAHAMLEAWSPAEVDLTDALDAAPQNALAWRLRAEVRLRRGNLAGAQADVERALALTPTDVDTLVLRGDIRAALAGVAVR
jgi:tetratricopeptide (TPR) repeat protein